MMPAKLGSDRLTDQRNLTKTLDYLDVFARFKDEENIKAVERLLNSHTELEMFERSQLGKCPKCSRCLTALVPWCLIYPEFPRGGRRRTIN
jgi:hypothetical protein